MSNVLINAPKTAKRGEIIELKALILHPMETGFRPGTNGRIIPRNIIERFVATWNGAEIFRKTPGIRLIQLVWVELDQRSFRRRTHQEEAGLR